MPFAVLTVWREPTNHFNDCYFCLTNTEGYSKKKKKNIDYPTVPSAIKPVPHGEGLPVPTPPLNWKICEPHLIQQNELNDLARDLGLSKQQSELLGSRLQEWNLLAQGTTITSFRKRNANFSFEAKIKEGVFTGPDIRKVIRDAEFENRLNKKELAAWRAFVKVVKGFLGNNRENNYKFKSWIYWMNKVRDITRIIATIETRYQGRWDPAMLGDYCWFLKKEDATPHKRKK
ncbi:hypothetical protein ACJJTC_014777 [Scirpophaga incertulas]